MTRSIGGFPPKSLRRILVGRRPHLRAWLLGACSLALVAAAAAGRPVWFAAAGAAAHAVDPQTGLPQLRSTALTARLRKLQIGLNVRILVRDIVLLVALAQVAGAGPAAVVAGVCLLGHQAMAAHQKKLAADIRRLRNVPVATRNIDLGDLAIVDAPSGGWEGRAFRNTSRSEWALWVGALIAAAGGSMVPAILGSAVTWCWCLVIVLRLRAVRNHHRSMPSAVRVDAFVDRWIENFRPTGILYFSGTRGSEYQVNMWLEEFERAPGRTLVVTRERAHLPHLAPTSLPILCVPDANRLMGLDLSSVRLVGYVANVGSNIHMLRMPGAAHVFLGHGDSDKVASVNPYCRVYDEVWTAGPAGRERFAEAGVRLRTEALVEVGRPQLERAFASSSPPTRDPMEAALTVLYAPTWEGWVSDPGSTSLMSTGAQLVNALVQHSRSVRVLYRPHPYTGIADPRACRADQAVRGLLRRHGAVDGTSTPHTGASPRWPGRPEADDAELSRDGMLTATDVQELRDGARRADEEYWSAAGPRAHHAVGPGGPSLYSCFDRCDVLITDVSSVASDFLATGKPFALVNGRGLTAEEFRSRFPVANGAYLLEPDLRSLGAVLGAAAERAHDTLGPTRGQVREHVLGRSGPEPGGRFRAAVRRILTADQSVGIPRPALVADTPAESEPV
ncbi:hypothetical protein BIV57_16540 [Mangrovactinospora gilvigrisea]|uniref:Uncharacterized protein n=1 Tax=Mangrovactinospora gilvigrisea TaxID=1428644 RepID=A0A1J7C9R3_9ACTN|nr:hypothetical protein [Mangrovactinospora gilvigrisea]OIV36386.1 hypothetical protein BIV57_16540 [Mangrovactinospora gilvigrisea]